MAGTDGKVVRYAVVGLGHIAQVAVLPAFKHARENSILAAIVSDDTEKRAQIAKHYDVPRTFGYDDYERCLMSGEIDAVYIALPNYLHREYAVRAADAGIHVLCEKPMAVTDSECEQMIFAAERNRVKLMIAYRLHFEECTLETIELVRRGEIGEPRSFDSVFTQSVAAANIRLGAPEHGGGTLYDIGVYCINAARALFDSEPEQLFAFSANNGDPRFLLCDEMTSAMLRFPRERLATFTCSFGAADVSSYRIVGTRGDVRVEPGYEYAGDLVQHVTIDGKTKTRRFDKRDQFAPELVYFSNCVLNDETPEPSGYEGLADVRVVRALYASARDLRPYALEPMAHDHRPSLDQAMHMPANKKPRVIHAKSPSGE